MFQPFQYLAPHTLAEACAFLRDNAGKAMAMAGGTDLLVRMHDRHWNPAYVVDIKKIPGLTGITVNGDGGITIGAATTLNAIARHPAITARYTVLAEAAHVVGSYQVRNRATIGGNICNASPAADTAASLLALEAMVSITGPDGERRVPLAEFFTGPGKTVLVPGELVTTIELPTLPAGSVSTYRKLMRTRAVDLSQVGLAVVVAGGAVRIALGAVAATPIRATGAEALLAGRSMPDLDIPAIAREVAAAASPISDLRASREYRLHMIEVMARRALTDLLAPKRQ